MSEFDEYIVHGEPELKEKADARQTAIGQSATEHNSKRNICTLGKLLCFGVLTRGKDKGNMEC